MAPATKRKTTNTSTHHHPSASTTTVSNKWDYDAKYGYSDIASVIYVGNGETSIYPNPAALEMTITTIASTSAQVMDVYDRILIKQDISEGQNTIHIKELPIGFYIFVLENGVRYKILEE